VGESRRAFVAAMWASCCCRVVGELLLLRCVGELLLPRSGRAVVAELWASSCCRDVGELLLPRCVGELLLPRSGRAAVAAMCGRALVAAKWASFCCRELRELRELLELCKRIRRAVSYAVYTLMIQWAHNLRRLWLHARWRCTDLGKRLSLPFTLLLDIVWRSPIRMESALGKVL
jgi:hypothetical protein